MLQIEAISAFRDNYIWLLHDSEESGAWVVDPGDAAPVFAALAARALPLAGILVTHHHPDHVGGIAALRARFDVPVYGPLNTPAVGVDHPLREGDQVRAAGREFSVLTIPGHTLDHIAYFSAQPDPVLFCGDTLFGGGCGRVFEGTLPMMYGSLQKLAALPAPTRVYCAHEYTLANLRFALTVDAENVALRQRSASDQQQRAADLPTVPSTLAVELATNPFLRCDQVALRSSAERFAGQPLSAPVDTFAVLRRWKDDF